MICLPHAGVYLCGACFCSKSASLLLCSGAICILSVVHLDLVPFSLLVTSAATGPVLQDKLVGCHDCLLNLQAARERKNHMHEQLSLVNNSMTLQTLTLYRCPILLSRTASRRPCPLWKVTTDNSMTRYWTKSHLRS